MAGFLVSPHMPYTMSVVDETDIQTWADIGVIFTLFSLGLDFSFKKIVKMRVTMPATIRMRARSFTKNGISAIFFCL